MQSNEGNSRYLFCIKLIIVQFQAVMGDANYDSEDLPKYIINDLKALAIIPHNPRREQPKEYQIKENHVIC